MASGSVLYILLLSCPCVFAATPTITVDRLVATIAEHESSITDISGLACQDPDGGETVISLDGVVPTCTNCFQVYPGYCDTGGGAQGPGQGFCLRFLPLTAFNFDQNIEYTIRVQCIDNNIPSNSSFASVYLRLIPNTPPQFVPNSNTVTVTNTENIPAGGSVLSVSCTDANSDTLTYGLTTTVPSTNLFEIDSQTGVIRATADLRSACFNLLTFRVTCQDPYNTVVRTQDVQATFSQANQRPVVNGLNFNLDLPEDEPVGSTLATFQVSDDDSNIDCLLYTDPLNSRQYFNLDTSTGTTRSILLRSTLNYEVPETRNTNVTVECDDDYCKSYPTYVYVRVTDVNEPVTLQLQDLTVTTYEGQISIDPQFAPIDPDQNEQLTYSIVGLNNAGRFTINPSTGLITSTVTYDVDNNNMPSTDSLIVQVRDTAGHTATATLTVSILDSNDNAPVFTTGSQTITITDCASTVGSTIGSVLVATDQDSSFQGNNQITFSGSSGPISITSDGHIVAGNGLVAGSTYSVQAQATDAGQVPRSLTSNPLATITVIVTACPTTTTPAPTTQAPTTAAPATTGSSSSGSSSSVTRIRIRQTISTNSNDLVSLDENLGWIIVAALLAMVLLAALVYMIWRYCYASSIGLRFFASCNAFCGDCCGPRKPPPRPVRPARPAVRGQPPRNGNPGFWQERYPDDDYIDQPNRDRTPSPARMDGGGAHTYYQEPTQSWRPRALPAPY